MRQVIFLVEDNPEFSSVIAQYLSREHEVRVFKDPQSTLHALAEGASPQMIITDINMPSMDGLEFIQALRARHFDQAIVAVSGFANTQVMARAFELGIVDFIEKPFSVERLAVAMKRAERFSQLNEMRDGIYRCFQELTGAYRAVIESLDARCFFVENIFFDDLQLKFATEEERQKYLGLVFEGGRLLDDFEQREAALKKRIIETREIITGVVDPRLADFESEPAPRGAVFKITD